VKHGKKVLQKRFVVTIHIFFIYITCSRLSGTEVDPLLFFKIRTPVISQNGAGARKVLVIAPHFGCVDIKSIPCLSLSLSFVQI